MRELGNYSCLEDSVQCTSLRALRLQGSHCKQCMCTGHKQIVNMLSDGESAVVCNTKNVDGLCTHATWHSRRWYSHSSFAPRWHESDFHRFNPIPFESVLNRPVLDMYNFNSTRLDMAAGTMRYESSANSTMRLPGLIGCRSDAVTM